ncbi:hypothetical protein RQP46_007348 [Phenoliferia psychrophenolica]
MFRLTSLLCLIAATAVSARIVVKRGDAPLTPDLDPFYKPDPGWENAAPGAILRSRTIVPALYSLIPIPLKAWQLLYRTSDVFGKPLTTVTTIISPPSPHPDKLVAYATPEDASAGMCAPSYTIQLGASLEHYEVSFAGDYTFMAPLLLQGLTVTFPDTEGPNSVFGAGKQEGAAVLDGLRATINFGKTIGINPTAKPTLQGGFAVGWAAAMKDTYAPELALVGVAQGGTPADLKAAALNLNGYYGSGLMISALVGLMAAYPEFKASLESVATPKLMSIIKGNADVCLIDLGGTFVDVFGTDEYLTCGISCLDLPVWKFTLEDTKLGFNTTLIPTIPLHVVHAKNDEFIPLAVEASMVSTYCQHGANLEFISNNTPGIGHIGLDELSTPGALAFLNDRLDGVPFHKGCKYSVGV